MGNTHFYNAFFEKNINNIAYDNILQVPIVTTQREIKQVPDTDRIYVLTFPNNVQKHKNQLLNQFKKITDLENKIENPEKSCHLILVPVENYNSYEAESYAEIQNGIEKIIPSDFQGNFTVTNKGSLKLYNIPIIKFLAYYGGVSFFKGFNEFSVTNEYFKDPRIGKEILRSKIVNLKD